MTTKRGSRRRHPHHHQEYDAAFASVNRRLGHVHTHLRLLNAQLGEMMATLQEVKDELTAIKVAVDAGKVTAQAQIAMIAELTAQIAAGSPVTQADLDALDAQADEILAALAPSV